MEIELYSLLSSVIVLVSVVTVIFAVFSYLAFRLRQRASMRQTAITPPIEAAKALEQPKFFKPLYPNRLQ
jgi:heme/copper-type cytochrome/quinol oxidase subunit 2